MRVPRAVHSRSDVRTRGERQLQDRDPEAGQRLRSAITEALSARGRKFSEPYLERETGIARSVLRNWWLGVPPGVANIRKMAEFLEVSAETLWLRWLGYEVPDAGLAQIAAEIRQLRGRDEEGSETVTGPDSSLAALVREVRSLRLALSKSSELDPKSTFDEASATDPVRQPHEADPPSPRGRE